jgi:hypothetical protein
MVTNISERDWEILVKKEYSKGTGMLGRLWRETRLITVDLVRLW